MLLTYITYAPFQYRHLTCVKTAMRTNDFYDLLEVMTFEPGGQHRVRFKVQRELFRLLILSISIPVPQP